MSKRQRHGTVNLGKATQEYTKATGARPADGPAASRTGTVAS